MSAAENLQREDLSAIEKIETIVEIVDAELIEDKEYLSMGNKPADDSVQDNSCAQKNMLLNKMTVPGSACCYLFSFVSKENKSKNKLCVLCAAVRIILSKTLLGSPFKPPFLGVVVDFFAIFAPFCGSINTDA